MFEQHVTRFAPFIYQGLKGVGLEGYMFQKKTSKSIYLDTESNILSPRKSYTCEGHHFVI